MELWGGVVVGGVGVVFLGGVVVVVGVGVGRMWDGYCGKGVVFVYVLIELGEVLGL